MYNKNVNILKFSVSGHIFVLIPLNEKTTFKAVFKTVKVKDAVQKYTYTL